LERIQLNFH